MGTPRICLCPVKGSPKEPHCFSAPCLTTACTPGWSCSSSALCAVHHLDIISIKEGKVSRSAPGLCHVKIVFGIHSCSNFTWRFRRFLLPTAPFQSSPLGTPDIIWHHLPANSELPNSTLPVPRSLRHQGSRQRNKEGRQDTAPMVPFLHLHETQGKVYVPMEL